MRISTLGCAIVVAAAVLSACQAATQLTSDDDMAMGASAPSGGTQGVCSYCFGTACAWQVTECSGDPGCAKWLGCAQDCPADEGGNPSATCLDACPAPSTPGGQRLSAELQSCVRKTEACCGGAGGKAPTTPDDAGMEVLDGGASWDNGDGDAPTAMACSGDTCMGCLGSIKSSTSTSGCAADDPECQKAVADCVHEPNTAGASPNCLNFSERFAMCALSIGSATVTVDQCVWAVPPASIGITLQTLRCAASHCDMCVAAGQGDCITCQIDSCEFEMSTLLGDADAQGLFWCLRKCASSPDQAACRSSCATQEYPGGVPVMTALSQCVSQSCASQCSD